MSELGLEEFRVESQKLHTLPKPLQTLWNSVRTLVTPRNV